jgi:hypothetical protein
MRKGEEFHTEITELRHRERGEVPAIFPAHCVLLKAKMFAACTNFVPQPTVHVIPAQAGIQFWTPAFAGVTPRLWLRLCRAVNSV